MPDHAGALRPAGQGKTPAQIDQPEYLAGALRRHFRVRALSLAQRHGGPEVLPQHLEKETARTVPRPAGTACEEMEILDERRHRARVLAAIHGRVSGHRPAYVDAVCALACGAGRPQMV